MGLTFSTTLNYRVRPLRGKFALYVEITFDTAYPSGGYDIAAADVGVTAIHHIQFGPCYNGKTAYYVPSTKKIHVMLATTGAEQSPNDNIGTTKVLAKILYS